MQTTQDQINDRLNLLPETKRQEVLLFIDFLLNRLGQTVTTQNSISFKEALGEFRSQVEVEGSDLAEVDFFQNIRDRSPAPTEPRW